MKFTKQDIYDIKSFARDRYLSYPNHPVLPGEHQELTAEEIQIVALFEGFLLFLNKQQINKDEKLDYIVPVDKYRSY